MLYWNLNKLMLLIRTILVQAILFKHFDSSSLGVALSYVLSRSLSMSPKCKRRSVPKR